MTETNLMADAKPTNDGGGPQGELSLRTLAMPANTNQNGDIFGGWLLGQMDIGGGIFASKAAEGRTVTVAIDAMNFRKPVYVGDVVSVYVSLIRIGTTSITVHVEAWVMRREESDLVHVTEGNFTYVAVDENIRPRPVKGASKA
jgi:acyl-CoA thioesterase YciA